MGQRRHAGCQTVLVGMHDQIHTGRVGCSVAQRVHVAELPGGVDVQHRERRTGGMERLAHQMQQRAAVLADGVEQHRPRAFGGDLADHVDRVSLETV